MSYLLHILLSFLLFLRACLTYLERGNVLPDGGRLPLGTHAVHIGLQPLQRAFRLRQPRQELINGSVQVVKGVHRGMQVFAAIHDAATSHSIRGKIT